MNGNFENNFNKNFKRTQATVIGTIIAVIILGLGILTFIGWVIIKIMSHFGII